MKVAAAFAALAAAVASAGCTTYPTEVRYPTQTAVHPVYGYVDPPLYAAPPLIYGPAPLFWGGAYYGHRHYWRGASPGYRASPTPPGGRGSGVRGRAR